MESDLLDFQCHKNIPENFGLADHRRCESSVSFTLSRVSIKGHGHGYHG